LIRRNVVKVPQHWFNAYPASAGGNAIPRASWKEIAEEQNSEWILPAEQSGLEDDIYIFWQNRTAERLAKGTAPPVLETVIETELASLAETEGTK
jgi:SLT domain-containing protein